MGVFHSIAQQIYQYLLNSDIITKQYRGQLFINLYYKFKVLLLSLEFHHIIHVIDKRSKVILGGYGGKLSRFDFGYVKNVINDAQKRFGCGLCFGGVAENAFITAFSEYHFIHAYYCVDRRSDLVRHLRKKLCFASGRLLCFKAFHLNQLQHIVKASLLLGIYAVLVNNMRCHADNDPVDYKKNR